MSSKSPKTANLFGIWFSPSLTERTPLLFLSESLAPSPGSGMISLGASSAYQFLFSCSHFSSQTPLKRNTLFCARSDHLPAHIVTGLSVLPPLEHSHQLSFLLGNTGLGFLLLQGLCKEIVDLTVFFLAMTRSALLLPQPAH